MRKTLLDIPIDWLTTEELEKEFIHFVASGNPHQITTVNSEFIVLSQENREFKQVLQESDISLPDGTSIVLAQTYFDRKPQATTMGKLGRFFALGVRHLFAPQTFSYKRITGVELAHLLLQLAAEHGWRVFLLGASPGVAQKAAELWAGFYPGLTIVGASSDNPGDKSVLLDIHEAKPDVLLVAYGAPKQDLFIARHKQVLRVPIMVGVGGTFDYATGNIHRPPAFVRVIGLEWLVRLIQQPKRFKRIYRSTIVYISRVIHYS